ncbi:MAG: hypothetical protein K6B44_02395 [Lachnospiraceae bacterium]|nr:hypothetical protein [Lachnospiraceae bacterium]
MKFKDILNFKKDLLKLAELDKTGETERIYREFLEDEENRTFFEMSEEEAEELDPEKLAKGTEAAAGLADRIAKHSEELNDNEITEYRDLMKEHAKKLQDAVEDEGFEYEGDEFVVVKEEEAEAEIEIEKEPEAKAENEAEKEDEYEIEPMTEEEYNKSIDNLDGGLANVEELAEMNVGMKELGSQLRKKDPVRDNDTYNVMMALRECEQLGEEGTISEMKAAYGKLSVEIDNYLRKMDRNEYKNPKNTELREMFESIGERAKEYFKDIDEKSMLGDSEDTLDYSKPLSQLKKELQEERDALENDYTAYRGKKKKKAAKNETVNEIKEEEPEKTGEEKKDEPKKEDIKKEEKKEIPGKEEENYRYAKNMEGWGKEHFIYESKYTKKTNVETLKKEEQQQNKEQPKPDYSKLRMSKGSSFEIKAENNEVMDNNKPILPKKK